MSKHGSRSLVLGALIFAVGCGSSKGDPKDSDSEGGEPSAEGGAAPGSGGGATSGKGGAGSNQGGALGVAGRATGGRAGTAGIAGAPNECPTSRCGGDVVGSWEIVESCLGTLIGVDSCPGLKGDASRLVESGTITYNADSTYTSMNELSGMIELTYPLSCIAGLGCADLATVLSSNLQGGYQIGDCEDAGDACVCPVTVQQTNQETGTYTVKGNVLLQTRTGAATTLTIDYCVDGDSLSLSSANSQSYRLERR